MRNAQHSWGRWGSMLSLGCVLAATAWRAESADQAPTAKAPPANPGAEFETQVRPLLKQYCLSCHSTQKKKGDLDLERFTSLDKMRNDLKVWQAVHENLDNGEMPPKKSAQPMAEERRRLATWVRDFLNAEARARAGDPGRVVLRRLNNAEYDNTVRDLTGVDLHPAHAFPKDGAAGEGFSNAGDALAMSPALLGKYLKAAKAIAAHGVLLPEGIRFSPGISRRDWTDEILVELREFHRQLAGDGKLSFQPYLAATIRHREPLSKGQITIEAVAAKENLNTKYLAFLWRTLNDKQAALPLDRLQARWRLATVNDIDALVAEIQVWQALLWKFNKIGSYGSSIWQEANLPNLVASHTLKLKPKLAKDQKEVVFYLVARTVSWSNEDTQVLWQRPRFEGGKQTTLLLRDLKLPPREKPKDEPAKASRYDRLVLDPAQFGRHPSGKPAEEASLVVRAPSVLEVRVPAEAFQDREFVVEAKLDDANSEDLVQFEIAAGPPRLDQPLGNGTPCVASSKFCKDDPKRLLPGFKAFRLCFPIHLFFPKIVPDDEIICLRLYFREDEPLTRLFLNDGQKQRLDRLWQELRFVSQQPSTEFKNYPTFMGFVSQDGKESAQRVSEQTREPVLTRAAEFVKDLEAAQPKHLASLLEFATRAYRRPLEEKEKDELLSLYRTLRKKESSHEEAFQLTMARVLVSPSFLYRLERPAPGKEARPVSSWELATRLSYFLWATLPDDELRQESSTARLTDPQVLATQVKRLLKDTKTRGLATEFAAQWLQVRDFRENREKNEKLFPTFDNKLRSALFEETVLFFQDLYQNDRSVLDILDADHTFLDETLAKHYGIPNVAGPQWRRVGGMKLYGRGGVLGMGSVLTKQSGASRTSPVLRGNWLVETILGEKMPRPPADVPRLPEEEAGSNGLTVRQMVEKHAHVAECALCHRRFDPFGFSLEKYDVIGRRRDKDSGGRTIDDKAELKDGTKFEGIAGLRKYLLTQRKEDFLRHFCKKLLGYSLGRSVTLSDEPLLEEMLVALKKNDYRFSAAVLTITQSQQFLRHRGLEATKEQ